MKTIALANSTSITAIVDDEDYDRLSPYRWLLHPRGYICRHVSAGKCWRCYYMHNEVLNQPANSGVDHINRRKWDNTKANLRNVSNSSNVQNSFDPRNSSGFKGVDLYAAKGRWRARINKDGKRYSLKTFETPQEAARAYDKAAIELHGPGALTNQKLGFL